ncbi:MAG: site-specific integrase [Planctomycetes bacterium]|nr:site-specific integrase [Planctomycetota bacterium]
MASVSSDPRGFKRILFVNGSGDRKAVRLGKMGIKAAETIRIRIEALNASSVSNTPIDRETAEWLRGVGDDLHAKMAAVGLTAPRQTARLGTFLEAFIDNRKATAKPNTITSLKQARQRLVDHFGAELDLRSITPADAEQWAAALAEKYAPATVGRTIKRARQFFKSALRDKIVSENPFVEVKASGQANKERQRFIDRETIQRVIDTAPNAEWRLIIALSRFGGLRCPSEHLALRWQDVDWARDRFLVRSSKTEHHADGGERWVPIFPELRPYMAESFDRAEPGAVHVITGYRSAHVNMRMQLARIIRKAGLKPWPRLFHNLRASRETELAAEYPIHVATAWIGNSVAIAAKHYLTVREEDFERAAQIQAHSFQKTAQIQAQQTDVSVRVASQESTEGNEDCGDMQAHADGRNKSSGSVQVPGGLGTVRRSRKVRHVEFP